MSIYFVVNSTVKDRGLLNEYTESVGPSLGLVPIKVLAADNESQTIEGTPAGSRTVVLEFENEADFRTWYDSPEYQAVVGKRLAATDGFGLIAKSLT
jgi:uncharacterized protein (DUF1330 family)